MDYLEQIVSIVIEESFKLHRKLGPGVFESADESFLAENLIKAGLIVERQKLIPVSYAGMKRNDGF